MVAVKLRKYAAQLHCLRTAPPATVKAVVKSADRGLVQCLCECSLNILKGHVRLSAAQKKKLARHKRDLRSLVARKTKLASKKRILQKGGFLPALLAPLAKGLLPLVIGAVTKRFLPS